MKQLFGYAKSGKITEKKVTNKIKILGYFSFFNFICNFFSSHVTIFSISKKLIQILRNEIKKESWQFLKKKSYSNSKNVNKMYKKLKNFSLKIHKDAGTFEKPPNRPK